MVHNPGGWTAKGFVNEGGGSWVANLPNLVTQFEFSSLWAAGAVQQAVQLKWLEMTQQYRQGSEQLESGPLLPGE